MAARARREAMESTRGVRAEGEQTGMWGCTEHQRRQGLGKKKKSELRWADSSWSVPLGLQEGGWQSVFLSKRQVGWRCWHFGAAEVVFSPSQGDFEQEAGWGKRGPSLPLRQLPPEPGQLDASPGGALSPGSCGTAEHKALKARAGAGGSTVSLCSSCRSGPLQNCLALSPAVYLLQVLCLDCNPSGEGTVFCAYAQHPTP